VKKGNEAVLRFLRCVISG